MSSDDFHAMGWEIVSKIDKAIEGVCYQYSLLVGGGLGYESKKYLVKPHSPGDIDLCVIFENNYHAEALIKNEKFNEEINFDPKSISKFIAKDTQNFLANEIAVLRLSSTVRGYKTSVNIMSFPTLENSYEQLREVSLNKQAHTKTYSVFNAISSNGSESIAVMYSPENWYTYSDSIMEYSEVENRIVIDKTWLIGKSIYAGLMTDFIAKGQIYKDTNSRLLSLQNTILRIYVSNSSESLKNNAKWHRMFANSNLFSDRYRVALDQRLSDMEMDKMRVPKFTGKERRNLSPISVFTTPKLYMINPPHYIKRHNNLLRKSALSESISLLEILDNEDITYDRYMLTINAECKRLTRLICSSQFMKTAELPCLNNKENDLCFVPESDDIWYSTNLYSEQDVVDFLGRQILSLFERKWRQADLAQLLLNMRIDVLLFISSQDSRIKADLLEYFSDYPKLLNIIKSRDHGN